MPVIQGEQYQLPIKIMLNHQVVDDSVDSMTIQIGEVAKSTPVLTFHDNHWLYPLTQEETESWPVGYQQIQATWVKGNTIRKTPIESINVLGMLDDE